MNGIMAPIPDPQETADLQGRTAKGSTILALLGAAIPSSASIASHAKYPHNGAWVGLARSPRIPVGSLPVCALRDRSDRPRQVSRSSALPRLVVRRRGGAEALRSPLPAENHGSRCEPGPSERAA
jgi:hypothetical protein